MKIWDVDLIVSSVLERFPETRNDNNSLYVTVCEEINPMVATLSFGDALTNTAMLGIPEYESVTRSRRKVQANREDLRADKKIVDARYEKYKEVKKYAIS